VVIRIAQDSDIPRRTMVLHNPNNWHWVNKDVSPWAKDYLTKELLQISAEEDGVSVKVDSLMSMDGDVDVSQRKGKVITIFDVKLKLEYKGTFAFATWASSAADVVGRQEQGRRRGQRHHHCPRSGT
jgi:activator of HSP90 ATPase